MVPEDRSLEDRAYDLFGEMLIERETAALLAEIEAEKARGDTAEMDAFLQSRTRKIWRGFSGISGDIGRGFFSVKRCHVSGRSLQS